MQRHTRTEIVNHSRSDAFVGTVSKKTLLGFYVATTLDFSSAWYTQDICSVRMKGF